MLNAAEIAKQADAMLAEREQEMKEHEQMSKMSSKNREIFEKLDKLVKQPGISKF